MKNITFSQACCAIFGAFACSIDDGELTYFSENEIEGEDLIYFNYASSDEAVSFWESESNPKINENGVIVMQGRRESGNLESFEIRLLKLDTSPILD